ncbi:CGNR zinc finger [compost metagenome]
MTGSLLAADLVTLLGRGWDIQHLRELLSNHEIRQITLTTEKSQQILAWATLLEPVFTAESVDARLESINILLANGATKTYVTAHDGLRPHLHFASEDQDLVARVKAVTAGGLAIFIVESGGQRLGICQRAGCSVAFVDTSRNGLRAYCSARCGNRDAVDRHRSATRRDSQH